MTHPLDSYTLSWTELDPPELLHKPCGKYVYDPTEDGNRTARLSDYVGAAYKHTLDCEKRP